MKLKYAIPAAAAASALAATALLGASPATAATYSCGTPFSIEGANLSGDFPYGGANFTVNNLYVSGGCGLTIPGKPGSTVSVKLSREVTSCIDGKVIKRNRTVATKRVPVSRDMTNIKFTIPSSQRATKKYEMSKWTLSLSIRPYDLNSKATGKTQKLTYTTITAPTCQG